MMTLLWLFILHIFGASFICGTDKLKLQKKKKKSDDIVIPEVGVFKCSYITLSFPKTLRFSLEQNDLEGKFWRSLVYVIHYFSYPLQFTPQYHSNWNGSFKF
ncbi:hypothetical protein JHK82_011611 [Glycine max]|uniref:Uncharacterized protein n=2 Tax=Glycine subgen. Soja TaxID=1462606 RepID=A0A0R0JQ47_SOYBN|nr:hypothetical protein JHK85_011930 [Glycine max]KAG5056603.1 hypothetical protein JHK86_011599 [Glycine max]KAG5153642.1 hypothetical protein JHK82_011611 [Glycine max]KRH56902.1 hypothetical protein GLYMA_05G025800v4 [Glycine max]RZC10666.1 hypothetical protein D0Y65_011089 [Glycine soja]